MHPAIDAAMRVVAWWHGRRTVHAVRDAGLVFSTAIHACWAVVVVWCTVLALTAAWARSAVLRTCALVALAATGASCKRQG
jgi:hypothetical protein